LSVIVILLWIAIIAVVAGVYVSGCCSGSSDGKSSFEKISDETLPEPQIEFAPREYVCYRTAKPLIIDGRLDDAGWQQAAWTENFIDIEGESKPAPRFKTRVKMLWDDKYFYVAADMEEPDIWGTLTQRDAVIFHDNDFEVFIDPDGDTHEYYELEVNALGTEWDLFLVKPYRDGGPAVDAWDIRGLKTAVNIDGTINKPGDVDRGWSIEIAIPWAVLRQCAHKDAPPKNLDQWRVNFSRVEWQTKVENGKYVKLADPQTGNNLPEDNWVWSPQGLINMHYPEMWGLVQFSDKPAGSGLDSMVSDPDDQALWKLRKLYYKQRTHMMQFGYYTTDISRLGLTDMGIPGYSWPPEIAVTSSLFEACVTNTDDGDRLCISQDGRLWRKGK